VKAAAGVLLLTLVACSGPLTELAQTKAPPDPGSATIDTHPEEFIGEFGLRMR
jgi:hypothetical protein